MIVLGLTGSIGMGKSTVARMFADEGVPVFEADKAVHELYRGEAVPLIEAAFPGTTRENEVDRTLLSRAVLNNSSALAQLESIVHPLVHRREQAFVDGTRLSGAPLAVLDIPLLFENWQDGRTDLVVVVSAPEEVQRARVLERPGMSEDKLNAILKRQMPDAEKRARADIVIDTSGDKDDTRKTVRGIVERFTAAPAV
jgi:dephospho-CoA kinase